MLANSRQNANTKNNVIINYEMVNWGSADILAKYWYSAYIQLVDCTQPISKYFMITLVIGKCWKC